MKNLIKLFSVVGLFFVSCEAEKTDGQVYLDGTAGKAKISVKKKDKDAKVIKECSVVNADRCGAPGYPESVFWWPIANEDPEALFSVSDIYQMTYREYDDGSINIVGKTELNGCVADIDLWLINGMDYAQWIAIGGKYKDETPYGACSETDPEKLTYYIVDETRSTMEAAGCGDRDGLYTISHRPSNMTFGFQVGEGGALYDTGSDFGLGGWAWAIDASGKEHKLDFNFVIACEEEKECETAFARDLDGKNCFLEDDFDRWGWSIGPLGEGTNETYEIYAAAGQCDIYKGELVGSINVTYDNGEVKVEYHIDSNYEVTETHTYAGKTKYPSIDGEATVAPGQYSIEENLSGDIYVIAHAVVCKE